MTTIIPAGMTGVCGICNKQYQIGTRILKDRKTGKWVEADCAFPSHKRDNALAGSKSESRSVHPPARDNADSRSPSSAVQGQPELEDAEAYASALLKKAISLAQKEAPGWESMSEYPYLIATLVQTRHGKISGDRIAKLEEKKLEAYGNRRW